MSNSPDISGAVSAWEELDESEQFALARSVARRRVREWKRELSGVTSVGAGYRTRRGTNNPRDEVCLRFSVQKKKESVRSGAVPEYVIAYAEVNGGRRRCAIPTDVDVIAPGEAHAGNGLKRGVVVRPPGASGGGDIGSICAVVEDDAVAGAWYLLSCNHVLALPRKNDCSITPNTDVYRADGSRRSAAEKIGYLSHWKELNPGAGFGLDAALAFVDRKDLITNEVQGVIPKRVAADGEIPTIGSKIYSARRTVPAKFVGEQFDLSVPFGCGARVRLRHVFLMKAATHPGDSGSPLVGLDGTLFGMHFYLTGTGTNAPRYALSIPASELFRDGVMKIKMNLVT